MNTNYKFVKNVTTATAKDTVDKASHNSHKNYPCEEHPY